MRLSHQQHTDLIEVQHAVAIAVVLCKSRSHLQENGTFLSFPYVCPEPVLAKC